MPSRGARCTPARFFSAEDVRDKLVNLGIDFDLTHIFEELDDELLDAGDALEAEAERERERRRQRQR